MIPKSRAYSFRTQIVGGLAPAGDSVEVADIEVFPELGAGEYTYAVLSDDPNFFSQTADYETIRIDEIDEHGSTLSIEERGVEGEVTDWPDGTYIYCPGTSIGWEDLGSALDDFESDIGDAQGDITDIQGDVSSLQTAVNARLPLVGGVMTGRVDMHSYTERVVTLSGTGTITLDLDEGNVFDVTIDDDIATTIEVANAREQSHSFTLLLHQHSAGPNVTFDFDDGAHGGEILWAYNVVLGIEDDTTNIFTFFTVDEGATWYGHLVGQGYGDGS